MERTVKRRRNLNVPSLRDSVKRRKLNAAHQRPAGLALLHLRSSPTPTPFLAQSATSPVADSSDLCFADTSQPFSARRRVLRHRRPKFLTNLLALDADAAQTGYNSESPADSQSQQIDSPQLSPRDVKSSVYAAGRVSRGRTKQIENPEIEKANSLNLRLQLRVPVHSNSTPRSETAEPDPQSSSENDSDETSYSDFESGEDSSDDDDDIPMLQLLMQLSTTEEDCIIATHGYETEYKLCDSLQGSVYVGRIIAERETSSGVDALVKGQRVTIKVVDKALSTKMAAVKDDITFMVEENIRGEAEILRSLAAADSASKLPIAGFVDFFESARNFYLVTRYVDGMQLGEFVAKAHAHINEGRLSRAEYLGHIRPVFRQLVELLSALHSVHGCAHLDICAENLLISGVRFIETGPRSKVTIRREIKITMVDFGFAELFERYKAYFGCTKFSLVNAANQPLDIGGRRKYDAKAADMWALGVLLFTSVTGQARDVAMNEEDGGYAALRCDRLDAYLRRTGRRGLFSEAAFSLLRRLLDINERSRITPAQALRYQWLRTEK